MKTEIAVLRARLAEAEEALRAIRAGEVDAVVVSGGRGEQLYSLEGADRVYRQLIETMSEGAVTLSEDGAILYGNAGLLKILKRPVGKVLGALLRDCLPADERGAIDSVLAQARSEPIHHETRIVDGAGALVPVYLSISRIETEGRSVFGVVLTDLTAQNSHQRISTAQAALQESAAQFRTLAESMPQIVWVTGPGGDNIFFNQRWMDYTGMTLEESLGDGWSKPFHPDDQQRAWDAWQKATKENGVYSLESRLRRADGVYRWWLVRGVPLIDAGGKILKWYGTCTDIHDMKLASEERLSLKDQLAQSQKMESVGRLAGGVAHDFNNLLTAINGYAGFVLQALPEEDPTRKDVEEILAAGERAGRLTKQLLAFSRKQILNPQILDINETVDGTAAMLKRLIGEDIKLETRLDPSPCRVKVDAGQLEQVLLNLAVNARDAMPTGGTLTFQTQAFEATDDFRERHPDLPRGRIVCLCARDTGCGMAEDVKAHLFEPFFSTKETGKGTGLGLSMVYGIIKQSGGDIDVESSPGRGAAFRIYFPQSEPEEKKKEAEPEKEVVLRGNETILLVEDEPMVRRLAQRALAASGYTVLAAENGEEALEVLQRHGQPVDLLITDVVMPGMSGRQLALKIAGMNLSRRTLFVSGYTDDAIVQHGILEPGLAFLNKPFAPSALLRKLREVLDGPANHAKP